MGFAIKSHVYIQAWDEARNAVGNEAALKVRLQITKRIRIHDFLGIGLALQLRMKNEKC
jgi:hypothetical protein